MFNSDSKILKIKTKPYVFVPIRLRFQQKKYYSDSILIPLFDSIQFDSC